MLLSTTNPCNTSSLPTCLYWPHSSIEVLIFLTFFRFIWLLKRFNKHNLSLVNIFFFATWDVIWIIEGEKISEFCSDFRIDIKRSKSFWTFVLSWIPACLVSCWKGSKSRLGKCYKREALFFSMKRKLNVLFILRVTLTKFFTIILQNWSHFIIQTKSAYLNYTLTVFMHQTTIQALLHVFRCFLWVLFV